MTERRVLVIAIPLIFAVALDAHSQIGGLDDPITLTTRDQVALHLNVLSAQLTSGAFVIGDMGTFDLPVELHLTRDGLIEAHVRAGFARAAHPTTDEYVEQAFKFLSVAIDEMLTRHLPFLEFDATSDFVGYWYDTPTPIYAWTWREGQLFESP